MAYKHGVYTNEIPTAVTPPASVGASLPVVFGTAVINRSTRQNPPINEPVLCHTYTEAVEAFGYSDDWSFTLSEFIYSHFALYGLSPVVLVNVLDPATHKVAVQDVAVTVMDRIAIVDQQGALLPSVVVKSSDGDTTYVLDTDYKLDFDASGNLVVQIVAGGAAASATGVQVSFDKLDPSAVATSDIIGGIVSGQQTGLELIDQVFPRFGLVPGLILAPGYSDDASVAAVMTAKAGNVNSMFKAMAITDLPANIPYSDVVAYKKDNGFTSELQINTFPKATLGDKTFHLSTHLAGAIGTTDADNDDLPFVSPSNKSLQVTATVADDGTSIFLSPNQANYLNGEGIVTAINFRGGFKAWGSRTGAYPSTTDPKDSFIPVRRMMNWLHNNIILSYWSKVDAPINRTLTESITDSVNIWLNGLVSQGALIGGRVDFLSSENPDTDLMDGIVRFHVYATPPSPAREINFTIEYDAQYLGTLFG